MTIVAIDKVNIGSNRRPLKDHKVADLMQSIKVNGLLNPITLDQDLTLIAGLHRLTACKLLGLTQIECHIVTYTDDDQARLAEIDENLIRNELEALERSELWLERDQILERMGLRARPGDNQYTHGNRKTSGSETVSLPSRTTLDLAKEIGYTDRTFQQGKQIARNIAPQVKEVIRGTPVAKSPRTLLEVARAGSEERKRAEAAERAAEAARDNQLKAEAEQQAQIAAESRARQTELQLVALQSAQATKEAKLATKAIQRQEQSQSGTAIANVALMVEAQAGDAWLLDRHLVYCGDSSGEDFVDCLPSGAALAIAPLHSSHWHHDYLVDEARVVAVVCSAGTIHKFCSGHRMPFRFELLIGDLYIALFSHQPLLKPERHIGIEGIEGIVSYLVSLYTKPGHFVISPTLGEGEVLMTCEKMGRICFACDDQPERMKRAIDRWQKWTGKAAEKTKLFD
jgi:ParB family transcriptional regulator, chromosome partitioning protein